MMSFIGGIVVGAGGLALLLASLRFWEFRKIAQEVARSNASRHKHLERMVAEGRMLRGTSPGSYYDNPDYFTHPEKYP